MKKLVVRGEWMLILGLTFCVNSCNFFYSDGQKRLQPPDGIVHLHQLVLHVNHRVTINIIIISIVFGSIHVHLVQTDIGKIRDLPDFPGSLLRGCYRCVPEPEFPRWIRIFPVYWTK